MRVEIPENEVQLTAVRSSGAGGQNVNKVSSAVHLRFDIAASSLPGWLKAKLSSLKDGRVTREGEIVIKAQQHRSQDMNRAEALRRLQALVEEAARPVKARRATKPTRASKKKRLEGKVRRGLIKAARRKITSDD